MGVSVCLVIFVDHLAFSDHPISTLETCTHHPSDFTIFLLLTISIGLPFFVLSTNSPLMQAWFALQIAGKSPYWLYALSNIGSILGLLAYPIVVEPILSLPWQGRIWAGGYIVFVLLAGFNAVRTCQTIIPNLSQVKRNQGALSCKNPKGIPKSCGSC